MKTRTVMIKIDIKTLHGHLFTCNKCNKFHFEFNQIAIDFSSLNEIKDFNIYLSQINGEKYETLNTENQYIRKIHIPFQNTAVKMVLNHLELKELVILMQTFIDDYEKEVNQFKLLRKLSQINTGQLN